MSLMPKTRRRFVLLAAMALSGCAPLLPGGTAPRLFVLSPRTEFTSPLPSADWRLAIAQPYAPAEIDSARIALRRGPFAIDYFADAAWPDRAPTMMQSLLLESFEETGRLPSVTREQQGLTADILLLTELQRFDAAYDQASGNPTVVVRILAQLASLPGHTIFAETRTEHREPVPRNDIDAIVAGFDRAQGAAMADIVAWALKNGGKRS